MKNVTEKEKQFVEKISKRENLGLWQEGAIVTIEEGNQKLIISNLIELGS